MTGGVVSKLPGKLRDSSTSQVHPWMPASLPVAAERQHPPAKLPAALLAPATRPSSAPCPPSCANVQSSWFQGTVVWDCHYRLTPVPFAMSKVSFLPSPPAQNVLRSCTCPLNLGPSSGSLSLGSWQKFTGFGEIRRGLGAGKVAPELEVPGRAGLGRPGDSNPMPLLTSTPGDWVSGSP